MGKVMTFDISLSSKDAVYCAGQTIEGVLNLEINAPIKLKAIRIVVKGKAFVHWTEQNIRGPGEYRSNRVRHFSSTEEYFDYSITLLQNNENPQKSTVLPSGRYAYPFHCQLPPNLPSSFEGQYGHVRYWVRGSVEKKMKYECMTKLAFTVVSALDLNSLPEASERVIEERHKHLCCLCCTSGSLTATLSLARRGYVPGEPIVIYADVENLSGRKMSSSSVELKMTTQFHASGKSRSITTQLQKLQKGCISKGRLEQWNGEKMYLPPLPPSYLLGCSLIDIQYSLELRVEPMGPALDLRVPVEIIVGTVPLHSSIQEYLHTTGSQHSSSSWTTKSNSDVRGHFGNTLNSVYKESLFHSVCIKDEEDSGNTRGDLHYCPKYTFYLWKQ